MSGDDLVNDAAGVRHRRSGPDHDAVARQPQAGRMLLAAGVAPPVWSARARAQGPVNGVGNLHAG